MQAWCNKVCCVYCPRWLWGGLPHDQTEGKKTKKKYAIRDSNPENLLGRQKCYPYTNGVFFRAQHRWVRSDPSVKTR